MKRLYYLFRRIPSHIKPGQSYFINGTRYANFHPGRSYIKKRKTEWQEFVQQLKPYPNKFHGRGIVICAGGLKYFTCAWVNIQYLRKLGCRLPIELWYRDHELTPGALMALEQSGVTCRNAADYGGSDLNGFSLKPFAILHSAFKEVLFLDADNNCTADPVYLFESTGYKELGTIFWPDVWKTDKNNPIWKIVDSAAFDLMEQESGQLLINKEKCWKELNLCMYFNVMRRHYHSMLLGDKDTFKFAWIALRTAYYMIPTPLAYCGYTHGQEKKFIGLTMAQHDETGKPIFLHRNLHKWDITKNEELIWKELKRYRPGANEKHIYSNYIRTRNATGFHCVDIGGDVEVVSFRELFGDMEIECLEILKALRSKDFYGQLLLHMYLLHITPAYVHNAN